MKRFLAVLLTLLLSGVLALAAPDQQNDDRIYDEVRRRLANDPDVKGGALECDVKDGVVIIRGEVNNEKARQKAERLARKVKGVTKIDNQLRIKAQ